VRVCVMVKATYIFVNIFIGIHITHAGSSYVWKPCMREVRVYVWICFCVYKHTCVYANAYMMHFYVLLCLQLASKNFAKCIFLIEIWPIQKNCRGMQINTDRRVLSPHTGKIIIYSVVARLAAHRIIVQHDHQSMQLSLCTCACGLDGIIHKFRWRVDKLFKKLMLCVPQFATSMRKRSYVFVTHLDVLLHSISFLSGQARLPDTQS